MPACNNGTPASEHIRLGNSFIEHEHDLLSDLQAFIERNGKPCCLNLITDRDNAFLKNLEKQKPHTDEHHDPDHPAKTEEEEDELARIIREEEEENKKRQEWLKIKAQQDTEEAEKRKIKEK